MISTKFNKTSTERDAPGNKREKSSRQRENHTPNPLWSHMAQNLTPSNAELLKGNTSLSGSSVGQCKTAGSREVNSGKAAQSTDGSGLPDSLRTGLESLSGLDLSATRVHRNSSEPAKVNAHAYTQGHDIYVASGQEKHLPHEGWHVVQQMQGRVKPTIQTKGKAVNNEQGLEQEADVMGKKALQLKGVEKDNSNEKTKQSAQLNQPIIQRATLLGEEWWKLPGWKENRMKVWVQSTAEWKAELGDMDDESDYKRDLRGFLKVSNDPSIVGRTSAPNNLGNIPYRNDIDRAPTDTEQLDFMRALYDMGGGLDLWHGSVWEGGNWIRMADKELSKFIRNNQAAIIAEISAAGEVIDSSSVQAVAEQGGRKATMAMIMNGGATAHKGVDLIMTANGMTGQAKQTAHATAMETIRNSGRVIRNALIAHDARVAFEQAVVGTIFDRVWAIIPGGGTVVSAGVELLKMGLKKGLENAMKEGGPSAQAEEINNEFVATCNRLIRQGHIQSADAQDAINGFEAVRR